MHQAGVGIPISFWLSTLGFIPVEERVGEGMGSNSSLECPPFLGSMEEVLESVSVGDSIILLGNVNAYMCNDSENWKGMVGMNGPTVRNQNSVLFSDFCARHTVWGTRGKSGYPC